MRRLLIDPMGGTVPQSPGATYNIIEMQYRISDSGDPEGDILILVTDSTPSYPSMASLPVWSAR